MGVPIMNADRGLAGAKINAADRGLAPPASSAPAALSDGPMSYADAAMSRVEDGQGAELLDGFELLAAWLELANDATAARELRELARTLFAPDQTPAFYDGLALGLQMGVTQASVDALKGYREGFVELKKTIGALLRGDLEALETVMKGLLQLIMTFADVSAIKLESIADDLMASAASGRPEFRAFMLELAVTMNQCAKLKRMAAVFLQLSFSEMLAACEDFVAEQLMDSVRDLTQRMLDVRTSGRMVGEELGTWLGVVIASSFIFALELIVPIAPPRKTPEGESR